VVTKIANPDKTGVNSATENGKRRRTSICRSKIKMASAVDFSTKLFKVKVWSPVAGKTFVKV
jgi:hypothetical protein